MTHEDYEYLHQLLEDMDVDSDPKDIRRGMPTFQERELYSFLTPSRIRDILSEKRSLVGDQ